MMILALGFLQLQKAASQFQEGSSTFQTSRLQFSRGDAKVLDVVDRVIKIIPWLIVLILGLVLISKLA